MAGVRNTRSVTYSTCMKLQGSDWAKTSSTGQHCWAHGSGLWAGPRTGAVIEDAMQVVGREGVGEGLRALPVVDAQKGVVGKGETDAGGGELAGQPAMPIAIERQTERAPGRHAQIGSGSAAQKEIPLFPSRNRLPAACR